MPEVEVPSRDAGIADGATEIASPREPEPSEPEEELILSSVEVVPFEFGDEAFGRLLQLLGQAPDDDGGRRRAELNDIATDHRTWCEQDALAPSRAKSNKAIREVMEISNELQARLRALDDNTEWSLVMSLAGISGPWHPELGGNERFTGTVEVLDQLVRAAGGVLARTSRPGPEPKGNLSLTIQRLADFYEKTTGKRPTHSAAKNSEYKGTPQSPAGRFMEAFFKGVDSAVPSTSVGRELNALIRHRREKQKDRPEIHPELPA